MYISNYVLQSVPGHPVTSTTTTTTAATMSCLITSFTITTIAAIVNRVMASVNTTATLLVSRIIICMKYSIAICLNFLLRSNLASIIRSQ